MNMREKKTFSSPPSPFPFFRLWEDYPWTLALVCAWLAGQLTLAAIAPAIRAGADHATFHLTRLWLGLLPVDVAGAGAAALALWFLNRARDSGAPLRTNTAPALDRGSPFGQALRTILWVYPLVVGLTFLTMKAMRAVGIEPHIPPLLRIAAHSRDPRFWASFLFATVLLAPIAEEFLFRLVLFESLREWRLRQPAVISAACFALIHLTPAHFPGLFVLGLALSRARRQSGGLLLPMLIHALFNATSLFFLRLGNYAS